MSIMMYLGKPWTVISLVCFSMCKGQYFNNTILLTPSNRGIAAIPGEKLTLKCAGTVRQTGLKVLRLWGSTFGPVEDIQFGNETKIRVNKTIPVTDTTQEDVHCSLLFNNRKRNTTRRINISWIEQFQISAKEVVVKDQSNINVICLIPTMEPELNITLRYGGQELLMNKKTTNNEIRRNIYTQLMNITKADNGQTVKCCVDIRNAGETCKGDVLNILFPPSDMKLEQQFYSTDTVVFDCKTGESNPASVIDWHVDGLNFTLGKVLNGTGPNRGYIVSQALYLYSAESCSRVQCRVTNEMFSQVNISRTQRITEQQQTPGSSSTRNIIITAVVSVCCTELITLAVVLLYRKFKRVDVDTPTGEDIMLEERLNTIAQTVSPAEGLCESATRQYEGLQTVRPVEGNYMTVEQPVYMTIDE